MRSTSKAALCLAAVAATSLTLVGVLDRPATASNTVADAGFAVVDSIGLLEQMLQQPEYQSVRDTVRIKYETKMNQLQTANAAIAQMLQTMDQNDPAFQTNVNTYQNQQYQMQDIGGQFSDELDMVASEQAVEIYAKVTDAVNTVAAREGIDNVLSNRSAPDNTDMIGLAGVTQQIMARPVMRTSAVDLTVAVRDELGLPDPAVAAAERAAAEAAAQAAMEEAMKAASESTPAEPAASEEPAGDQDDGSGG